MSVVLVCLPNAPQVSEEAVKRDAELDKYLESRVEGEKQKNSLVHHTIPILFESIHTSVPGHSALDWSCLQFHQWSHIHKQIVQYQSETGLKHCPL